MTFLWRIPCGPTSDWSEKHVAIAALIARVGLKEPCAISGGGALNVGLIKKIEELGIGLLVPPQPQIVNALGAALIAGQPAA